jgi:hypothetical protein
MFAALALTSACAPAAPQPVAPDAGQVEVEEAPVATCPPELVEALEYGYGGPATPIDAATLGDKLGVTLPEGAACIFTGSSGYVGETAYNAFYPDRDQALVDEIHAAYAAAGYVPAEDGRFAKDGQWGAAGAYPAGDSLHYGDYFGDAAMVLLIGSVAAQ